MDIERVYDDHRLYPHHIVSMMMHSGLIAEEEEVEIENYLWRT